MRNANTTDDVDAIEVWARAEGYGALFRLPNDLEKAVILHAWWPIPLAAAWWLRRDPDDAVDAWVRQKNWGIDLWRSADWAGAQQAIWEALKSEQLNATGSQEFDGVATPIDALEWQSLTWKRPGPVDVITRRRTLSPAYYDVLVDARQCRRLWPRESAAVKRQHQTIAAETRCRQALENLMRLHPGAPISKDELKQYPECSGVGRNGFNRAFVAAVRNSGAAAWSRAGRRSKSSRSKSSHQ
jgi:hypothetical protein